MGCDIHCWAEIKKEHGWHPVLGDAFAGLGKWYGDSPFECRDYTLFSYLADVRNSHGAWTKPIDEPRGLPEDVSPYVQEQSDECGVDGHSHSYLSLRELEACEYITDTYPQNLLELRKRLLIEGGSEIRIVFWFDN